MAKEHVIINVNGKPKILKIGFNGLIELEEMLDKPISEISGGDVQISDLRTIFFIALKHGGYKEITLEETGEILDSVVEEEGMQYLTDRLTIVFNNMMGGNQTESFLASKK